MTYKNGVGAGALSQISKMKSVSLTVGAKLRAKVRKTKVRNIVPIIGWGMKYDIKKALLGDVVAGVTVAVMQVLSSMADALLANVQVFRGLYCSIFPVIIYAIFGPSRHISIGTNSLICMLVGSTLTNKRVEVRNFFLSANSTTVDFDGSFDNSTGQTLSAETDDDDDDNGIKPEWMPEILATIVILVAMWQTVLAICQFGKLSWMFSDIAMSGYTAGAGIHLLTSQMKTVLGIHMQRRSGALVVYYTWYDLFSKIDETNFVTLAICAASIILLIINEEVVKPFIIKKIGVPIPMQFLLVIVGIPLSSSLDLYTNYNVSIVEHVPKGLPAPVAPNFGLFQVFFLDALIIAIVGYGFTLSMAKLIAKKFNYSLNGNQELFAEGMSNFFGAFFQCLPASASMSRSMTQATAGGTTQITGLVSSAILIAVMAAIGYILEPLPKCILAAVIVVALKGVLLQITDFPGYFKKSKLDGLLWLGTFVGVVLTTVDTGMIICIGLTIFVMVFRNYQIAIIDMEDDDDDDDANSDSGSVTTKTAEDNSSLAFRIIGVVSFANYEKVLKKCNKKLRKVKRSEDSDKPVMIIDLTSVPYIDQTACKAFIEWVNSVDDLCYPSLVAPEGEVKEMLKKHDFDEVQTFSSYTHAKSHLANSLSTVLEEGSTEMLPNGQAIKIQVQVFEDDEDLENANNMSKERIEYLKKRRQSRLDNAKALQATLDYMSGGDPDSYSLSSVANGGTPLAARRGSSHLGGGGGGGGSLSGNLGANIARRGSAAIRERRPSVMVVPPKSFRRRENSVF